MHTEKLRRKALVLGQIELLKNPEERSMSEERNHLCVINLIIQNIDLHVK